MVNDLFTCMLSAKKRRRLVEPLFGAALTLGMPRVALSNQIDFNRDVRPILSENCFFCHGQDANRRKSSLRLDIRESALLPSKSGEIPIVPGAPASSALVRRIFSTDPDEHMPPLKSNRVLTPAQKETLTRWI